MNPNLTKSTHKNNFTFGLAPPEYPASPSSQEENYGCKKNDTIVINPWDITSASKILYLEAFLNLSLCIQSLSINLPKAQLLLALLQSTIGFSGCFPIAITEDRGQSWIPMAS